MDEFRHPPELDRLLSGIKKIFNQGATTEAKVTEMESQFNSVRDEYNATLKSLQEKLAAERSAMERLRAQSLTRHPLESARFVPDKNQIEQDHKSMRSEIENLHAKLKTGIDVSTLEDLREFMLSSAKEIKDGDSGDIERRIRAAGLIAIFERCAEIAWRKLVRLMAENRVRWPEPHSLSPNASDEAMERARAREVADIRDTFLHAKPEAVGELVIGVVPAWKLSYPAKESWLWQQVALRAVASGIEAKIAKNVIEALKAQGDSIREEVSDLLKGEIESLSKVMPAAGKTIEEIDRMMHSSSALITKIVVERMMLLAQPYFQEEDGKG